MELKVDESWLQENGKYKCPFCGKEYSHKGICSHIWRTHGDGQTFNPNAGYIKGSRSSWNKGLTKNTDSRVRKAGETYAKRVENGEIPNPWKGKILSEEHKAKIGNSMKKAHKEGRAWNIGMSRWNNKPSYPEEFFMEVIANEFNDKEYVREHPCGIYSIDFAWPHKKKAIEIDGDQHQRFDEYIERDKRKNKKMLEEGWDCLRIPWKEFYHNTKEWIKRSKEFIDD